MGCPLLLALAEPAMPASDAMLRGYRVQEITVFPKVPTCGRADGGGPVTWSAFALHDSARSGSGRWWPALHC